MASPREECRTGSHYLATVTTLLQRTRNAHPLKGLYEAAELQWFWTVERSTDAFDQLFWFDEQGRPEAAVIAVDFSDGTSALYDEPVLIIIVMPDATPEWVAHVVERGLSHVAAAGIAAAEIEVDQADSVMRDVLFNHGFTVKEDGFIEAWLNAADRPKVSPLRDGYRLLSRSETTHLPHHMINPRRPNVEQRLLETSIYRPDLDLVVLAEDDTTAGYGMFWFDPVSRIGIVEPMRTLDGHQQRGLARHILTAGINRLVEAGAERVSIGWEPVNPASGPLYPASDSNPTVRPTHSQARQAHSHRRVPDRFQHERTKPNVRRRRAVLACLF